ARARVLEQHWLLQRGVEDLVVLLLRVERPEAALLVAGDLYMLAAYGVTAPRHKHTGLPVERQRVPLGRDRNCLMVRDVLDRRVALPYRHVVAADRLGRRDVPLGHARRLKSYPRLFVHRLRTEIASVIGLQGCL